LPYKIHSHVPITASSQIRPASIAVEGDEGTSEALAGPELHRRVPADFPAAPNKTEWKTYGHDDTEAAHLRKCAGSLGHAFFPASRHYSDNLLFGSWPISRH
jgi:hypothetical protein